MKRISLVHFCMAALLLAGCLPNVNPTSVLPTVAASATPQQAAATPVKPDPTAVTAPTKAAATVLAPTVQSTSSNTFLPLLSSNPVAPDCARLPGFPACGGSLPLTGRLAVMDPAKQVIELADFKSKQTWQIKAPAGVKSISWLDQGNSLLAFDSDRKASLAWADQAAAKPILPETLNPLKPAVYQAADGSSAWLETTKDGAAIVHVRLAGSSKEQTWPAEAQPSDKIHQLLGWVPGTSLLLGGYHFAGNSMWTTGNRLYSLDARSGAVKELPANLPLDGSLQWHPTQTGLLVFSDSGPDGPTLATLDVMTDKKVMVPLADNTITTSSAAWVNNGQAILHVDHKPGAPISLVVISLTDWPAGTTRAVTQPNVGAGEEDDWMQVLPDGKHFLYIRRGLSGGKEIPVELRLGSLDGSLDTRLVTGITPLQPSPLNRHWETLVAYTP